MCWCRACAGPWKCVLECASWARTCVCSRARVHVCCAGAAGRAYSRRKRFARSRAVELPDVAASARPTAMRALFTEFFFAEVVVGLSAARDVAGSVPPGRALPCSARRARSHRCDVHRSAGRCRNVQWSCLCIAVEMCVGVCTVGAFARVLARACARVPRRCCRTRLPPPGTARPFPSCRTTGRCRERRAHRHAVHLFTEIFFPCGSGTCTRHIVCEECELGDVVN